MSSGGEPHAGLWSSTPSGEGSNPTNFGVYLGSIGPGCQEPSCQKRRGASPGGLVTSQRPSMLKKESLSPAGGCQDAGLPSAASQILKFPLTCCVRIHRPSGLMKQPDSLPCSSTSLLADFS